MTGSGWPPSTYRTELGGRLTHLDGLVRVMREVFRRDVGLGLGHGITSFMAAVNVWTAGSPEQQRHLADLLLDGGRASVAYHELAHGNDFLRNEFTARPAAGGYLLEGVKQVINNADRAGAWVLFARTGDGPGSRSHSVLLAGPDDVPADRVQRLARYRTSGVRGCRLTGLAFHGCPLPASALVGAEGRGGEVALRSFQVTRSALPGMAIGTVDTCLRSVLRFALDRRLYRRRVFELPHAAAVLTAAFADLLLCDSLSLAATRTVQLRPEQASVTAAAVKYLVPRLLSRTVRDLSVVLGARFYLREGEHAVFGKHLRDLPVLSLGHAGPTACLATLIPQLRRLATVPSTGAPGRPVHPGRRQGSATGHPLRPPHSLRNGRPTHRGPDTGGRPRLRTPPTDRPRRRPVGRTRQGSHPAPGRPHATRLPGGVRPGRAIRGTTRRGSYHRRGTVRAVRLPLRVPLAGRRPAPHGMPTGLAGGPGAGQVGETTAARTPHPLRGVAHLRPVRQRRPLGARGCIDMRLRRVGATSHNEPAAEAHHRTPRQ
ncbi:acyl-CoA dehydrogenase family protein [Streptomyces sp. GLT-R25]